VLLTSVNPLRIYLYDDGLVRFASNKYTNDSNSVGDVFMHLTNYSINKVIVEWNVKYGRSAVSEQIVIERCFCLDQWLLKPSVYAGFEAACRY
jgi:hypothetical protein